MRIRRRKQKQETQTELLHRRYNELLVAISKVQTSAAFFSTLNSPTEYGEICKQITTLRNALKENVFFVLPSARIL